MIHEAARARNAREGVGRPEQRGGRPTRLGRREVRVLCGVGLKGAACSGKTGDASTGAGERREPAQRAANPSTGAGWGFGDVHHQPNSNDL